MMIQAATSPAPSPLDRTTLLDLRVSARVQETPDIIVVELAAPDGAQLPAYAAGAHVDVHLGNGMVRQYSLCGDPSDRTCYRLGILLDPQSRGGSRSAHAELATGGAVRISLPHNNFPLSEEGGKALLFAGGIGITPLLAMAYRLHALGRTFDLHYCTRSREQTAFAAELAATGFASQVHLHHDDELPAQRLDLEQVLTAQAKQDRRSDLYVCGPAGFIGWVVETAKRFGWPDEAIHREYFAADIDVSGESFAVDARRSGKTVTVAAGQSIAEALQAAGIKVPLSCEEGVCGTCETHVLAGTPDHRDFYLSKSERAANKTIMVCCSRSQSPVLALDI